MTNIWKIMIKTKNPHILNNLHVWVMSQTFPVYNFKWLEDISEFDQSFTKNFN